MKNLKRVLALVLVVAMFAGLMITSNAAFSDDETITNTEAVEVLNALGIIEGYEDGSYQPTKTVTRAEMAAIICRMLLGANASAVEGAADTGFSDVPASHWASGYVAYCVSKGIIAGYGDGTFKPSNTVTVAEATKMLLVAADVDGEFTGDQWALNVIIAGVKNKVIAAGAVASDPCTRDAVALATFNDLFVTNTPSATGDWAYDSNQSTWVQRTVAAADSIAATVYGYTGTTVTTTGLYKATADADAFGRPDAGYFWKYKNKAVSDTIGASENLVKTYENESVIKYTDLYTLLGVAVDAANVKVYIDGVEKNADPTNFELAVNASSTMKLDGTGYTVEVYYDADADTPVLTVVAYSSYLAKVTKVVKATTDKYTGKQTAEAYLTVAGWDHRDMGLSEVKGTYTAADAVNYKVGDYVLVTVDYDATTDAVKTVAPAKTVSGKLSKYTSTKLYVGDTAYNIAYRANADAVNFTNFKSDEDVYYLDNFGNVIKAVPADSAEAQYVYVLAASEASYAIVDSKVVATNTAPAMFADGTYATISVEEAAAVGLYTYTVADDVYTLTSVDPTTADDNIEVVDQIKNKTTKLATDVYANANTVFVVANYETKTVSGVEKTVPVGATVYTGYAKVPTMTLGTESKAVAYVKDKVANFVFVVNAEEAVAGVNAKYAYFTGAVSTEAVSSSKVTTTYEFIIDGETQTLALDDATALTAGAGLYAITNSKAEALTTITGVKLTADGGLLYNDDVIYVDDTIGTMPLAEDVVVYVFSGTTCEKVELSDTETTDGDAYIVYDNMIDTSKTTATAIAAIYIIADAE